jgi:uncharacterized protein YhbP (UPF0306 family)
VNLNEKDRPRISQANHLIAETPAMTLATACDNMAWAAPVYYAAQGPGLYFFSSQNSRHIQEATASGQAACAIHSPDVSWKNLLGLQMAGKIRPVNGKMEAAGAIMAYVRKFPFVKNFFSGIISLTLTDFSRHLHADLYVFLPESIFFMDNSVAFGFRQPIDKEDLFP